MPDHRRRDPRRYYTAADRSIVRLNQNDQCARCGGPLPDGFHMHHRTEWSKFGPTVLANAEGLCPACHRKARNVTWTDVEPRGWQLDALTAILPTLREGQMATIAAAPGAGKTLLSAFAGAELFASESIERMVVFVPNDTIRSQWAAALSMQQIHLDPLAPDGVENPDNFHGAVLTYQRLNDVVLRHLKTRAQRSRTFYVLDEVHHLGEREHSAWARYVTSLVGNVDRPDVPVLNLSGTLFRSDEKQRIPTVRYVPSVKYPGKIESVADYDITTKKLVSDKLLRHPVLHKFDNELEVVNLDSETVVRSGILDLDGNARSDGLRQVLRDPQYLQPKLQHMLDKLAEQEKLLEGYHVKGLVICENQGHAKQVHGLLADLMRPYPPMLAVSDEQHSRQTIKAFREVKQPLVLVTCRMVTEGFDCPDVTTLAHLTSWSARLFINQMVARAMRITQRERDLDRIIPAAILIPNDEKIIAAYKSVFREQMRVAELPAICHHCGQSPCICTYLCPRCGMDPCVCERKQPCLVCGRVRCICPCPTCGRRPCVCARRYHVDLVGGSEHVGFTWEDEDVSNALHAELGPLLNEHGVPPIYWPGATVAFQKQHGYTEEGSQARTADRPASPREVADALRTYIDRCAGWMTTHGAAVNKFQYEVNKAGSIPQGGRPAASCEQLRKAADRADQLVRAYCVQTFEPVPTWLGGTPS